MYAHLNFTDFNVGTCLRGGGRREWEEEQRRLEEEARRREEEEARRREVERVRLKEVRAGISADSILLVILCCVTCTCTLVCHLCRVELLCTHVFNMYMYISTDDVFLLLWCLAATHRGGGSRAHARRATAQARDVDAQTRSEH